MAAHLTTGTNGYYNAWEQSRVPNVNDDFDKGFGPGSTWSTTGSRVFICTKGANGAAEWKEQVVGEDVLVRFATTANIADLAAGAPNSVDGITPVAGNLVLVKNQSTASQNGIYEVSSVGTGSDGVWARAQGYDETGEIRANMKARVAEGTANADTTWQLTTNEAITVGTTAQTWVDVTGDVAAHETTYDHTLLASANLTAGDIIYADATPDPAALAIGAAKTHLRSTGTAPAWSAAGVVTTVSKTVAYTDLGASGDETVNFDAALPSGAIVLDAYASLGAEFAGGSISACTAKFGFSSNDDSLFTSLNVFTGAGTGEKDVTLGVKLDGTNTHRASGLTPQVRLEAAGDTFDNATAGSIDLYVTYVVPE